MEWTSKKVSNEETPTAKSCRGLFFIETIAGWPALYPNTDWQPWLALGQSARVAIPPDPKFVSSEKLVLGMT